MIDATVAREHCGAPVSGSEDRMTEWRPNRRLALHCALAAALMAVLPAAGWSAGPPRLTVVGPEGERSYSVAELRAMGEAEITTSTPWTDGVERFTGVTLAQVLGDKAPAGGTLRLIALNDYESQMPVADVGHNVPVIAYSRNGRPMSIRDKGPFWVVFPFDSGTQYQSEQTFSRSVWQLVRIVIEP